MKREIRYIISYLKDIPWIIASYSRICTEVILRELVDKYVGISILMVDHGV